MLVEYSFVKYLLLIFSSFIMASKLLSRWRRVSPKKPRKIVHIIFLQKNTQTAYGCVEFEEIKIYAIAAQYLKELLL